MMTRLYHKLRSILLRLRHRHVGLPKRLSFGKCVRIAVTDRGIWRADENLAMADLAQIIVKYGVLTTGRNTHVGIGAVITCREEIEIGDDVLIGEYVTIRDQDHHFGESTATAQSGFATSPIKIGANVWIGAKATITRGVEIGENSVIGANSVVSGNIPSNVVAVGAPARVIRKI